ncbi:MAG: hypothetical protein A2140_09660 [Candidatus Muproteobacteria bacterium RBG_16_62_13]|uniref:CARDB domain-containing protein n=1 Tax=Candidatus Muproteobacteria bacterium RBG_16_62_13 TaxID=1817756 RepID=A0A1F6T031_9PROT|nr:MAG: hypothetical protein A2140_09660 [Candidatus Muproteobacteria bacterium RBG_16_62_13]
MNTHTKLILASALLLGSGTALTAEPLPKLPAPTPAMAQKLPDLVVKDVRCGPGSKLEFTAMNVGPGALPAGWRATADVYFDGARVGFIDLGRPTSGDLTPPGGTARYLTSFDITRPVTAKVLVDATNSLRESNEGNNSLGAMLSPCGQPATSALPDLTSKRGMMFGGTPGGAGGRFVAWNGSINLTEADSYERSTSASGTSYYCRFAANFDVVNAGVAPVSRAYIDRIRRGAIVAWWATLPPPFDAGATGSASLALTLPAGTHQLNLSLDDDRVITESNEGNNSFTVFVTVGGTCP